MLLAWQRHNMEDSSLRPGMSLSPPSASCLPGSCPIRAGISRGPFGLGRGKHSWSPRLCKWGASAGKRLPPKE